MVPEPVQMFFRGEKYFFCAMIQTADRSVCNLCTVNAVSAHNDCVNAVQKLQKLLNSSTHCTQTFVIHVSVAVY